MSKNNRKTWLLLDCNYLCHRAKHSMGGLHYKGDVIGVIYGFLKSLPFYQRLFDTNRLVFCWDSKTSYRQDIFPEYKSNRAKRYKEMTDDEIDFELAFREQMKRLRKVYLKTIGFRNIFCQKGHEADDIMASLCQTIDSDDKIVIITSDKDLYQCLVSKNVSLYDPQKQKSMNYRTFQKQYGINVGRWFDVKAIAGCPTDAIPGIPRVGEKTAIKYLKLELPYTTKAHKAITSDRGRHIIERNIGLIWLPFNGTKAFKLKKDKLSKAGWKEVIEKLGMKSLKDKIPFGIKK